MKFCAMVEVDVSPPAPSPKRKSVGVVEPVPPRLTASVPVVSESVIPSVDVAT